MLLLPRSKELGHKIATLVAGCKQTVVDNEEARLGKMCKGCLKQSLPPRDEFCSETGAYVANFKNCFECGADSCRLKSTDKRVTRQTANEPSEREITEFEHQCAQCEHVVARHVHEFWIESGYQEYRMECDLCGQGEASTSVLPYDPKKAVVDYNNY